MQIIVILLDPQFTLIVLHDGAIDYKSVILKLKRAVSFSIQKIRFMSLLKSGQIANCCQPIALMTLKEYLEDYASPEN